MDFLKEMYFHELESKEKIFSRIQFTIATHILLLTGVLYILRTADYESETRNLIILYCLLIVGIILISISILYTIGALTGYAYTLLPLNESLDYEKKLRDHNSTIKSYNKQHSAHAIEVDIDENIYSHMSPELIKCIDNNKKLNTIRIEKNRKALRYLIFSLIPISASALVFSVFDLDASSPRKIQSVEDKKIETSLENINTELQKLFPRLTFIAADNKPNKEIHSDVRKQQSDSTAATAATSSASAANSARNCN